MARAVPSTGMRLSRRILRPAALFRRRLACAAVLAGLAAAGCAGSAYARLRHADEGLSHAANRSLRAQGFPARRVEARAYRGVIALMGRVASPEEFARAERAVEGLPGVRRVNNLILIDESSPRTAESAAAKGTPLVAARVDPALTP